MKIPAKIKKDDEIAKLSWADPRSAKVGIETLPTNFLKID
jgi:hypothetical protein